MLVEETAVSIPFPFFSWNRQGWRMKQAWVVIPNGLLPRRQSEIHS